LLRQTKKIRLKDMGMRHRNKGNTAVRKLGKSKQSDAPPPPKRHWEEKKKNPA